MGLEALYLARKIGAISGARAIPDLLLIDRDILDLAQTGKADDIAKTHVLATWFQGVEVYRNAAY